MPVTIDHPATFAHLRTCAACRGRSNGLVGLYLLKQGRKEEARAAFRQTMDALLHILDDVAENKASVEEAIGSIGLLVAGDWGQEVARLLEQSRASTELEPLLAGVRIYLKEPVVAPQEILEMGKDVADSIRQIVEIIKNPEHDN